MADFKDHVSIHILDPFSLFWFPFSLLTAKAVLLPSNAYFANFQLKAVLSNMMTISHGLESVLYHYRMNLPRVWVFVGKYKCCYQTPYSEAGAGVFAVYLPR